ncbi:MAG: NAD(P)/FAD-dependent oxidoreductase [Planctomycetes bacterium]|nr:NAD(P)/FAD-dependent oxidoreductase [Planctomycetota bacterium]
MWDVAVIGGGIAGMATAARLQTCGLSTIVLEAHRQTGGCAGYYCRHGFSFDVGATTLVDFEPGGVGGELLQAIGMEPVAAETLPGYVAWLPDRQVTLHRDRPRWEAQRRLLGDSKSHVQFWELLDRLADTFWRASRLGVKLPIRSCRDAWRAWQTIPLHNLPLARYARWTLGDALRRYGLRADKPLAGLLSMLVEDTVHSQVDDAPLINAALGITIRGAGLMRACGGMRGFWRPFVAHYKAAGGELRLGVLAHRVTGRFGDFNVETSQGNIAARQVVAAVPVSLTAHIGPPAVATSLKRYVQRDAPCQGGAIVVSLGVPEIEVACQKFTNHQLLFDYNLPLGNGNNMFVSVSSPGDIASAPAGYRAVMLSTHCDLSPWENLSPQEYQSQKQAAGCRLVELARRVYPELARHAVVQETGTPRTYQRFTHRPRGAVGGVRQSLHNANQHAVPYEVGCRGFWLVGDTTWPGLGTVACVLGSRHVAEGVLRERRRTCNRTLRQFDGTQVPSHHLPELSRRLDPILRQAGVEPRRVP